MVRYRKPARRSEHIEDRRSRPGRRAAGIGFGGGGLALIIFLLVSLFGGGGFDMGSAFDQLSPVTTIATAEPLPPGADPDADMADFMSVVLDDTQAYWDRIFASADLDYQYAGLVFFTDFTDSGCGGADARMGPHYCPLDSKVYLDFGFFEELRRRFGATGDLAPAYVLAHEIGHHVQNVLGINDRVRQLQQANPGDANTLSVRLELQADCFAGTWASSVFVDATGALEGNRSLELEPGEIREALEAAAAVGDDRIQEKVQGRVDPESWTHGSADQRQEWFSRGYDSADPNACDTFSGGI